MRNMNGCALEGKRARGYPNLTISLQNDKTCYLDVCKLTVPEEFKNDPTRYILSPTTKGLFVVVLQDKIGGRSHTVGIKSGLEIIYDCMETHELKLNTKNINTCCGLTKEFYVCCCSRRAQR